MLLGGLALLVTIGGISAFFQLFSKKQPDTGKLHELENEIQRLKNRVQTLEQAAQHKTSSLDTKAAPTVTLTIPPTQAPPVATPSNTPPSVVESTPISEDELTALALASKAESKPADVLAPTSTTSAMPAAASVDVANVETTVRRTDNTSAAASKMQYVPPPAPPNILQQGFGFAKNWLFGGNTLVRSGIVVLFIGLVFLAKFAADNNILPIELRLAIVALFGAGLLAFGWKVRTQKPEYAWTLQGGGVAVLYLTVFAAFKLYHLLPGGVAFCLLIAIAFLSATIAILQNAMPLAVLGFAGGFLAPILASTGGGSHVALFSYYLVLNLAITFVAYFKSWRPLNVLGFVFTFVIGGLWGSRYYIPENFTTVEPFLIAHFLLFTLIAVLYAHRQAPKIRNYVDSTLVFGTPLVGFGLQYALLQNSRFGLAYSALALGVFYMALAWWVLTRKRQTLQFLGECFLALGIGFLTLTLPLALDGRWTSAAWAVEGLALVWVGVRQQRSLSIWAGLALQLFAAGAFIYGWWAWGSVFGNTQNMFLGAAFIALSGLGCGALLNHYRPQPQQKLSMPLAMWGWLWWVGAGVTAIDQFMAHTTSQFVHATLAFVAVTSLVLPLIAQRLHWQQLAQLSRLLLPTIVLATVYEILSYIDYPYNHSHPFTDIGAAAWLFALLAYGWLLVKHHIGAGARYRAPYLWAVIIVGVLEWQYQFFWLVPETDTWKTIGWLVIPVLIMAAVLRWQRSKPLYKEQAYSWLWVGGAPVMALLATAFFVISLNADGNTAPLPYIPLLNPLDIALIAVLLLGLQWLNFVGTHFGKLNTVKWAVLGLMAFTLMNGILLRTLHHWFGTPYEWASIFDVSTVQLAFTLMWAITAFILVLVAHKRGWRTLWIMGASLMGLVVAKLFLLDLAQHGTVERILSFIGAGLILLGMGYFAPLPPASLQQKEH